MDDHNISDLRTDKRFSVVNRVKIEADFHLNAKNRLLCWQNDILCKLLESTLNAQLSCAKIRAQLNIEWSWFYKDVTRIHIIINSLWLICYDKKVQRLVDFFDRLRFWEEWNPKIKTLQVSKFSIIQLIYTLIYHNSN